MVSRRWVANEKHSGRPLLGKPEVLLETADKEGVLGLVATLNSGDLFAESLINNHIADIWQVHQGSG